MKPDQAIVMVSCNAVDLLQKYQAQGGNGSAIEMVRTLAASIEALQMVLETFVAEINEPGTLTDLEPEEQGYLLGEANAAAAGVLLVCSLLPGVDSLQDRVVH